MTDSVTKKGCPKIHIDSFPSCVSLSDRRKGERRQDWKKYVKRVSIMTAVSVIRKESSSMMTIPARSGEGSRNGRIRC